MNFYVQSDLRFNFEKIMFFCFILANKYFENI